MLRLMYCRHLPCQLITPSFRLPRGCSLSVDRPPHACGASHGDDRIAFASASHVASLPRLALPDIVLLRHLRRFTGLE